MDVHFEPIKDEILYIGTLKGTIQAELGMVVEKSSRTTGHNTGTVDVVEATVVVHYDYQRTAVFSHQGVVSLLARGGDSGSVIVDRKQGSGITLCRVWTFQHLQPHGQGA